MGITSKIKLRESTNADGKFVNTLTRNVMKEYVEATWSSTKDREYYYSINSFKQPKTKIIQYSGKDIGRITTSYLADRVVIDDIHILDSYQGQGIGRSIITQIIEAADKKGMPVQLILLKTNPAKMLYDALGFYLVKEDMYRYYMSTAARKKEYSDAPMVSVAQL